MERPGRRMLSVAYQETREIVDTIDDIAKEEGLSRADVLRRLIRLGLELHQRRVDAIEAAAV
jgi:hypothetical protein